MRIVMLSCNTGEGHNSTAKAIQEVLKSRGVECDLVDVLAVQLHKVFLELSIESKIPSIIK